MSFAATGCMVGGTAPRTSNISRINAGDRPKGTLFIVGGGSQAPELVQQFVDLAGGKGKARIAVLPMASSDGDAGGREKADDFRKLGAEAFVLNLKRSDADADSVVRQLSTATGVWFGGGDQARITAALNGSAALRVIHQRFNEGAVLGGTSAGAAIMSDSMLTGNQYFNGNRTPVDSAVWNRVARNAIEIVPGLGFLHNAIVDQHFIRRQRNNRLLSVVLERPSFLAVGIDEGTVLKVNPDGKWTILGASAVVVFDARGALISKPNAPKLGAYDVKLSVLPSGSTFDAETGRATLPPE
ncbi:MAG TPA: cyanophycinase [Gemmatimonadaceae bacterium]|nr:cyanophycinase [Gemmatimonadaceae bacterium]